MEKKLIPAPIDNKNVMKDWIEEIFDGGNCIPNGNGMMTGFVNNDVCSCWFINNLLFWEISREFQRNGGESYDILIKRLREHDTPPLVIKYDESMRDELFLCQKFYFEKD